MIGLYSLMLPSRLMDCVIIPLSDYFAIDDCKKSLLLHSEKERLIEIDIQTERQAGKQTSRQTDREREIEGEGQRDRQTESDREKTTKGHKKKSLSK